MDLKRFASVTVVAILLFAVTGKSRSVTPRSDQLVFCCVNLKLLAVVEWSQRGWNLTVAEA